MKIILDECLPHRLARELSNYEVKTVQKMGWSKKTNGELLALIAGKFDVFITVDQNLAYQQNMRNLSFAVVVLHVPSNKIEDIRPLLPQIRAALKSSSAGQLVQISA